jgi:two-component system sensor histidine kinase YesM
MSYRFGLFFVIVSVPLSALLIYQNIYASEILHREIAESEKAIQKLYMTRVDSDLYGIDKYLVNRLVNDQALLVFDRAALDDEYNLAKIDISNEFTASLALYTSIGGLFTYSKPSGDLVMSQNEVGLSLADRDAISLFLSSDPAIPNYSWLLRRIGSKDLLFRVLKSNTYLIGAWVDTKTLLAPLGHLIPGGGTRSCFVAKDGRSYPQLDDISGNHVDLDAGSRGYAISGSPTRYLVIGERSAMGEFSLVTLVPDAAILKRLPIIRTMNIVVALAVVVVILAFFVFLRKVVIAPLYGLMEAMRKLHAGDFEARVAPTGATKEFSVANATFNDMASQIHDLRIDVYEEQLHGQKAELQALRLQINPHFFLNSLNILYQLTQVKDYTLVQELTLCLSKYFQFLFRSTTDFVFLREEWDHIKNYLRIQELRFPNTLTCELDAPAPLPDVQIPPFLIQTFVENAIKYGHRQDDAFIVRISIKDRSDKDDLAIRISDSGPGFPPSVLQALRAGAPIIKEDGEHIGVANSRQRLHLLYGEAASLRFWNDSGAVVEVTLPRRADIRREGAGAATGS